MAHEVCVSLHHRPLGGGEHQRRYFPAVAAQELVDALGDLGGTAEWMARVVRPGGRIAIGEPFARLPFPPEVRERWPQHDRSLAELVGAVAAYGFAPTGIIASSEDDWDHYECQHWRAGLTWLKEHPGHAEADAFRRQLDEERRRYLAEERDVFGWAIVVAERLGS
jgi:hypothetical protein